MSPRRRPDAWWEVRRLLGGVMWIAAAGLVSGCSPPAPCGADHGCYAVADLRQGVVLSGVYQILDRDGAPLASVGGEARRWVHLEALPPAVPAAWIAVEDRRFRDHGGVDLRGLVRAALTNFEERGVAEGASTIPMQLVRALWPEQVWDLGRWKRKALELRMAPHLVSELGRDRVLELYLNAIYLGDGQYGVGAAARHYFGVSPGDLTLAQIATLVGMTKTPEAFNPREHPERARARRDLVLGILGREGVAGRDEIDAALAAELELADDDPASRERSYVTAAVLREFRRVAPELVDQGGLILHTTVDPRAQEETLTAMREHLAGVQGGEHGLFLGGDQPVEGAAIALETTTGAILAVVGGRDFASTPLNRALQSRRPVGSLVKPLIFAAALERGVRATRPLATAALAIDTRDGVWRPRDHVVVPYLLPHDMVVHPSNRAAVRLGQEVGAHAFAALARELGISGHIPMYPSTFLGAFDASLAEMTAAFAAFENGGRGVEPHFIRRIVNAEGITVWSRRGGVPARRLLHGSTADLVLDAMRGVVDEGTGAGVRRHLQGAAAGKTGTSAAGADAWFVGVRPGIAAGVWIGLDRPASMVEDGGGADCSRCRSGGAGWPRWTGSVTAKASGRRRSGSCASLWANRRRGIPSRTAVVERAPRAWCRSGYCERCAYASPPRSGGSKWTPGRRTRGPGSPYLSRWVRTPWGPAGPTGERAAATLRSGAAGAAGPALRSPAIFDGPA